jgi:sec-independent protein translocase protein TatA
MLGLDNPIHIAFILVLLLLVFGAKRLPEMGKSLGEGLRGFKESISGETPAAQLSEAHADASVRVDELPVRQTAAAPPSVATADPAAAPADHTRMHPAA